MKHGQKGVTLVEVVAVAAIVIVLGLLFINRLNNRGPARSMAKLIACNHNLHCIGKALDQYGMTYNAPPAYSEESAATTTDANLCAANLMRLFSCGLLDSNKSFLCPMSKFAPAPADAIASFDAVRKEADGAKYTAYNLTTCYALDDPANKIVVADMPFAAGNVTASVHDSTADRIDFGPQCLFKDGHIATKVTNLCPEGSSEHDLSPNGNIYRVDCGGGKGKDTCILGVDR